VDIGLQTATAKRAVGRNKNLIKGEKMYVYILEWGEESYFDSTEKLVERLIYADYESAKAAADKHENRPAIIKVKL